MNCQVGCVVVKNGEVIGEGFNYLPKPGLPLEREAENEEDTKYPYSKQQFSPVHNMMLELT